MTRRHPAVTPSVRTVAVGPAMAEARALEQDTGVATVAVVPHPVLPGERYVDGVRRSIADLAPR